MSHSPRSFGPLESFPLFWRWSQASHAVLPADVLATIRPLTPESAEALGSAAIARCPGCRHTVPVIAIPAWDSAAFADVRQALRALPVEDPTDVFVHWYGPVAVQTTWHTFTEFWDDFCYPGADDVTVWGPGATWALCYCHEEHFSFLVSARPVAPWVRNAVV